MFSNSVLVVAASLKWMTSCCQILTILNKEKCILGWQPVCIHPLLWALVLDCWNFKFGIGNPEFQMKLISVVCKFTVVVRIRVLTQPEVIFKRAHILFRKNTFYLLYVRRQQRQKRDVSTHILWLQNYRILIFSAQSDFFMKNWKLFFVLSSKISNNFN